MIGIYSCDRNVQGQYSTIQYMKQEAADLRSGYSTHISTCKMSMAQEMKSITLPYSCQDINTITENPAIVVDHHHVAAACRSLFDIRASIGDLTLFIPPKKTTTYIGRSYEAIPKAEVD